MSTKPQPFWDYAVEGVRSTLKRDGLQAAVDHAALWTRNMGIDAVKLLAAAKGVPLTEKK